MTEEERRTEIALFRYTLIVPLLRGEHPPGGKEALRRQLAATAGAPPHSARRTVSASSLARWERRYRQRGFDGLKPQPRTDRGRLRAVSPQTLDRAETLKREQPRRSARSIIGILTRDATTPLPEDHLAPRTLRRHLAARDATTARLLREQRPQPYRRFERTHFGDLWQGDAMDGPALPDPADPAHTRPADPQELRAAFRYREQRQVTKTATVSFRGNRYRVPAFLRGQTIELRYDPFDLAQLEVYFRDTFIEMAEVERLVTTVHPAVTPDPVPTPAPASGVDYLALLRLERERLLQAQLAGIHFTRLTAAPAQPQEQDRADPVD